jgi:hypothetical protein
MHTFTDHFPNAHKTHLEGGKKELDAFNPLTDKLYILAHGHRRMPVFSITDSEGAPRTWTATELVKLLYSDGLPTNWREIELLVCNAGLSVNTTEHSDQLLGLRENMLALKKQGVASNSPKMTPLKTQFLEVANKPQAHDEFKSAAQVLPLAAQFVQALKTHRHKGRACPYTNFRVISYAAKVAQNFSEGKVTLDLRTESEIEQKIATEKWGVSPIGMIRIWQ